MSEAGATVRPEPSNRECAHRNVKGDIDGGACTPQ
jgi:hypothetical protein